MSDFRQSRERSRSRERQNSHFSNRDGPERGRGRRRWDSDDGRVNRGSSGDGNKSEGVWRSINEQLTSGEGGGWGHGGGRGGQGDGGGQRGGGGWADDADSDLRTVMCLQLPSSIKEDELSGFFSLAGKVSNVRIVMDVMNRKPKGFAYVEFESLLSVPRAVAMSGQKLNGVPIQVRESAAHKNREATAQAELRKKVAVTGGTKLFVGSLLFSVTEEMVRKLFEPFGQILEVVLIKDPQTRQSKGYGFVRFMLEDDAELARKVLHGFLVTGRPMIVRYADATKNAQIEAAAKMGPTTAQQAGTNQSFSVAPPNQMMSQPNSTAGLPFNQTIGQLSLNQIPGKFSPNQMSGGQFSDNQTSSFNQLFGQLGTMLQSSMLGGQQQQLGSYSTPAAAAAAATAAAATQMMMLAASNYNTAPPNYSGPSPALPSTAVPISAAAGLGAGLARGCSPGVQQQSSPCLVFTNLFDPNNKYSAEWDMALCDDIILECQALNCSVVHCAVDRVSPDGHVYVKCPTSEAASKILNALNGHYFDERKISVSFIAPYVYHTLFPSAEYATAFLSTAPQQGASSGQSIYSGNNR